MAASFDVRDWIGWGAERNDPAWKAKATSWFNEIVNYSRETRVDLDQEITDFNDHLADAGWAQSTLTFARNENTTGRISDNYSTTRERRINSVRHTYEDASNLVEYDNTGGAEIYRIDRANRRLEVHSGAQLSGAANYYTNWQDFGSGYEGGNWFKDSDGLVHWRGLVSRVSTASGTPNAILLTDANARISGSQQVFTVMSSSGALRVDAFTNGQLVVQSTVVSGGTNITTIPAGGWVSLNGISYLDVWR